MRKGLVVVIGVFAAIAGIGGGFFLYNKSSKVVAPVTNVQPTQKPTEELVTWEDPSEFTFSYPKNLKLNPHEEDKNNYAHVELTSSSHPGSIIVWAKDTLSQNIETYVKTNKITGSIDTTLGAEPAKKYVTDDAFKKMTSSAIRNGYLYQIELTPTDADYWNAIFQTVNSSFTFTEAEQKEQESAPMQSSGDEDVSFDEEVIE